ncbi:MAG: hypothetical protein EZS28_008886 [Streblomastix strix]|uniref:FHA domain-containing protein n=1 Tax=Streblomastix strix TaxID=222440 RepID=A0A5J4WKL0_9EUKA|nr:MAG: hypothetical protein EZS28_008886 [Streblomastix strix]
MFRSRKVVEIEMKITQQKLNDIELNEEKSILNQKDKKKENAIDEDDIPQNVLNVPLLCNISTDWDLNNATAYYLTDTKVTVGSEAIQTSYQANSQNIVLQRLGINLIHCQLDVNTSKQSVAIKPIGQSKVMVNGQIIGSNTDQSLINGDRLIIGRETCYRFVYPSSLSSSSSSSSQSSSYSLQSSSSSSSKLSSSSGQQYQYFEQQEVTEEEINTLQAELAVMSGKAGSVDEYKLKQSNGASWILEAEQHIDEANQKIINHLKQELILQK